MHIVGIVLIAILAIIALGGFLGVISALTIRFVQLPNSIVRFLFSVYKKQVYELMVEDLYGQIPRKVSDPGIKVLVEQRNTVERWIFWMTFTLQRRMVNNPKEGDLITGMLLQLKIMIHIIGGGTVGSDLAPDTSPAAKARADRESAEKEDHKKRMEGVAAFKKREAPGASVKE